MLTNNARLAVLLMPLGNHAERNVASENIERASDRKVYAALAEFLHAIEISEFVYAARVCHWMRTVFAK